MIPNEILTKYNMVSLEQYKNMFAEEEQVEKVFYETFLKQTDHIPNKIIEKLLENLASATLINFIDIFLKFIVSVRTEYSEVLQYRKLAREEINRLSE